MNMNITIKYSCFQCGLNKVEVSVPARGAEDVVEWMESIVGHHIKADHTKRSPHCKATSVQNLMIPITGTDRVGGPVVH